MPSKHTVTLGLVQHACGPDRAANVDTACELIREAARKGAQIVATQELFVSTYFCQAEDEARFELAEPIPGPTSQRLCDLAKQLGIELTASLFEKRAPGVYHNTSIMIDPAGSIIGKYRKMHIPDDPNFYEKYYFTPGDLNWQTQQTRHATTGMLVCWDQWFPEAARLTAMRGAQVIFYPTAIGWQDIDDKPTQQHQRDAWRTMQRAHAIANGVFVAAINRVGTEGDITFWGSSFIADPGGVVIAEASESEQQVLVAECDLAKIDAARKAWPFLRDRRIDAYQGLTRRLLDE